MEENRAEDIEEKVMESSLNNLLRWDGNIVVTGVVNLPELDSGRPALEIAVRSMSSQEMEKIRRQSTTKPNKMSKRMGVSEGDLDVSKQRRITIFNGVTDPELYNSNLQRRFNLGSKDMTSIVEKLFLPGEQIDIIDKIMELSGIHDEDNEGETLEKNDFLIE